MSDETDQTGWRDELTRDEAIAIEGAFLLPSLPTHRVIQRLVGLLDERDARIRQLEEAWKTITDEHTIDVSIVADGSGEPWKLLEQLKTLRQFDLI